MYIPNYVLRYLHFHWHQLIVYLITVMEVSCGEHGDNVTKLVNAVNNGKCNNYQPTTYLTANTASNRDSGNASMPSNQVNIKDNISKNSSSTISTVSGDFISFHYINTSFRRAPDTALESLCLLNGAVSP